MQTVSATYERIVKSLNKGYETKLVIDDVGEFSGESLKSASTKISLFEGQPEIGKAVAQEIDITMLQPPAPIPRMACLRLYIRGKGIAAKSSAVTIENGKLSSPYASYSNGKITFSAQSGVTVLGKTLVFPVDAVEELTSEWLPQGVFYVDTRSTTKNENGIEMLTIHGFDAMLKAEADYTSNDVVGDAKDTAYVQAIADAIGVEVDSRTWEIMGRGNMMPFPAGYSMREILGYIAASYIGSFVITEVGKLRLISLLGLPEYSSESLLADEYGDVLIFGEDAILV